MFLGTFRTSTFITLSLRNVLVGDYRPYPHKESTVKRKKKKTLEFFPEWMEILTCGLHFPCARSNCSTVAMFLYCVMHHYGNMKDIVSSLQFLLQYVGYLGLGNCTVVFLEE